MATRTLFSAKVAGEDSTRRMLESIGDRAEDYDRLFSRMLDSVIEGEKRIFARKPRWPKLAASTVQRKAKAGQPSTPMVASGEVMNALTRRGGKGQLFKIKKGGFVFGVSGMPKAYYGHYGSGSQPKRPLISITKKTREDLKDDLLTHVMGGR